MGIWSTITSAVSTVYYKVKSVVAPTPAPSYTISVSGTPAGYTTTTSGTRVSTPGTPGRPGIGGTYGGTRVRGRITGAAPAITTKEVSRMTKPSGTISVQQLEIKAEPKTFEERFVYVKETGKLPIFRWGVEDIARGQAWVGKKLEAKGIPTGPVIKVRKETVRGLGKWILFSPAMSPTYAIEKSIAKPSGVLFKGVSQKIESGVIRTDVKFLTTEGRRGIATGFTKIKPTEDLFISKTVGFGREGIRALEFPTGRVKLLKTREFAGITKGVGKQIDEKFVQISGGRIAISQARKRLFESPGKFMKGTDVSKFVGVGFGRTRGETTFLAGKSISERGTTISLGMIKDLGRPSFGPEFISTTRGTTKLISKPALSSVQEMVRGWASIPTTKILPKPITMKAMVGPAISRIKAKEEIIPAMKMKTEPAMKMRPREIISPRQAPILRQTPRETQRSRARTAVLPQAAQIQPPLLKQPMIQIPREAFRPAQDQRPYLKPSERFAPRPYIPLSFFPKIPSYPLAPLMKRIKLKGRKTRVTQLGRQPKEYQPSFTALVLGIKAPKIPKAYKAGAGGLIIRPIITKKRKKKK